MIVLVVAPWRTRSRADERALRATFRRILDEGNVPVFAPFLLRDFLDDEKAEERTKALRASGELAASLALAGARCVQVGERITQGMQVDLAAWRFSQGAPVEVVR